MLRRPKGSLAGVATATLGMAVLVSAYWAAYVAVADYERLSFGPFGDNHCREVPSVSLEVLFAPAACAEMLYRREAVHLSGPSSAGILFAPKRGDVSPLLGGFEVVPAGGGLGGGLGGLGGGLGGLAGLGGGVGPAGGGFGGFPGVWRGAPEDVFFAVAPGGGGLGGGGLGGGGLGGGGLAGGLPVGTFPREPAGGFDGLAGSGPAEDADPSTQPSSQR